MAVYVNLDAMIPRADFAVLPNEGNEPEHLSSDKFDTVNLSNLEAGQLILSSFRKPDFQRETNHWSPEQVVQLIESFVNNELIPAVILWSSTSKFHIFVIDGGHRLSALRAWIEDDYGDKHISVQFFGPDISESQKKAAKITRRLIEQRVGSYQYLKGLFAGGTKGEDDHTRRASNMARRSVRVQWVEGNAEKAESSFYKINTQGTPLDDVEELLIKNRHRSIAIAARSIIRAGTGHKYWTIFEPNVRSQIETLAQGTHHLLFEPETNTPIKTLDMPLGGSAGMRTTLELLIAYVILATRNQLGEPKKIEDVPDDTTGELTIRALKSTLRLTSKISGDKDGSLGLHPAVYFYGPSGRHSAALFMGMAQLIAQKLANNSETAFFKLFTRARKQMEPFLIAHKKLIALIAQQTRSSKRADVIAILFDYMVTEFGNGRDVTRQALVSKSGLQVEAILSESQGGGANVKFSDETKSAAYIRQKLDSELRCPICHGYIDSAKSVSYDHIIRIAEGGHGTDENCQLVHPFCNQSIKG